MTGGFRSKALIYVYFSTATLLLYGDTNTIPSFREEEETVRSAAKPSRENKWAGNEGNEISVWYTRVSMPLFTCANSGSGTTDAVSSRSNAGTKLKTGQPFATANTFHLQQKFVSFLFSELPGITLTV